MLFDSRIYSFLHENKRFSFHLIDGQKIITDLAVTHNMSAQSLGYLRDTLLSSLMFERLVKIGENLGFYIDSDSPFFKYKLELSYSGKFRTMLLPNDLTNIPAKFNGFARLNKFNPNQSQPYTSIIEAKDEMTSEIINKVLKQSYQDDSFIHISSISDHSLMISKLPEITKNDSEEMTNATPKEFFDDHQEIFQKFYSDCNKDLEAIVNYFESHKFTYLSSKVLEFDCPCSREHYLSIIQNLAEAAKEEIAQDEIVNVTCDYCRTGYSYSADEITQG